MKLSKKTTQFPFVTIIIHSLIVIFIVLATRAYLGYFIVQQTIDLNDNKKKQIEQQITFLREYRLPYLDSDYAMYFINHENGVANPGEQLIKIKKQSEVIQPDRSIISPNGDRKIPQSILTGGWSWYLRYKLQQIHNN